MSRPCAAFRWASGFTSPGAIKGGAEGYFTGDRSLAWWAIGLSNTATYSSGTAAFVMLVLVFGLAGNWLWWAAWIVWMPLVALIWARMWRRMQIVTTAEFITLRYGGGGPRRPARCTPSSDVRLRGADHRLYHGFLRQDDSPLVPLDGVADPADSSARCDRVYTMFGGLVGVVYVDMPCSASSWPGVVSLCAGGAAARRLDGDRRTRHPRSAPGGAERSSRHRRTSLSLTVPCWSSRGCSSPGRPRRARAGRHSDLSARRASGTPSAGQLFNAFLALSLRTIPLIGCGIIAMSLFWTPDLVQEVGAVPAGMKMIQDPAYA